MRLEVMFLAVRRNILRCRVGFVSNEVFDRVDETLLNNFERGLAERNYIPSSAELIGGFFMQR